MIIYVSLYFAKYRFKKLVTIDLAMDVIPAVDEYRNLVTINRYYTKSHKQNYFPAVLEFLSTFQESPSNAQQSYQLPKL